MIMPSLLKVFIRSCVTCSFGSSPCCVVPHCVMLQFFKNCIFNRLAIAYCIFYIQLFLCACRIINGRTAMVGFLGLVITEALKGGPLIGQ